VRGREGPAHACTACAALTKGVAADDPEIDRENRWSVRDLAAVSPQRETACSELYPLLLRIAKFEARRRAPLLQLDGPELEDIAHQAAADVDGHHRTLGQVPR